MTHPASESDIIDVLNGPDSIEFLTIQDQILYENFGSISFDMDTIFSDPTGGTLTFNAEGTGLLEVNVLNNIVSLTEIEPAVITERITLYAENNEGLTANTAFNVNIKLSVKYRIKGKWQDQGPTEIFFGDSTYSHKNSSSSPDTIILIGKYAVNNETHEMTWDLDPITWSIDLSDIDTLRMYHPNGIHFSIFGRIE